MRRLASALMPPTIKIVLVLDNASWHREKSLQWHHIKSHRLAGYITNKGCELEQKLFDRLQSLLRTPDKRPIHLR
jgi:hypothetical protein